MHSFFLSETSGKRKETDVSAGETGGGRKEARQSESISFHALPPLVRSILSPSLQLGPLHNLLHMLQDSSVVHLMRTCHTLYHTEYPRVQLQDEYRASRVFNIKNRIPHITKILWDVKWKFERHQFPYVKFLKNKEWPTIGDDMGLNFITTSFHVYHQSPRYDMATSSWRKLDISLIIDVLKRSPVLTDLNLSSDEMNDEDAIDIAEALKVNHTLTRLNISTDNMGKRGLTAFGEALQVNSTLTELDVSYIHTNISNISNIFSIGKALQFNSTLTSFHLVGNIIGSESTICIAEGLKVNSTLTTIDLSYNKIGSAGASSIGEALKVNSTLTSINLCYNSISGEGTSIIGEALKVNSTLTSIDLTHNFIGGNGVLSISEALKVNSTLTYLDLSSNNLKDEGASHIDKSLQTNTTLKYVGVFLNNVNWDYTTALSTRHQAYYGN